MGFFSRLTHQFISLRIPANSDWSSFRTFVLMRTVAYCLVLAAYHSIPCRATDTLNSAVFCTASQTTRLLVNQGPHLKLLGLDLEYVWHEPSLSETSQTRVDAASYSIAVTPFSRQLPLPYLSVVNNVVERFVTFQLVK